MNVAILGASAKPERYSYKAFNELRAHGHKVFPVNPALKEIDKVKVYHSLEEINDPIDTITIYLSPEKSLSLAESLINKKPRRVIFNPGAENDALAEILKEQNTEVVNACTIVLLKTGNF